MGRKRKQNGRKEAACKGWKIGDIVFLYITPDDGTGFRPPTVGLIVGEKWDKEFCYFKVLIENERGTFFREYPPFFLYPPEE